MTPRLASDVLVGALLRLAERQSGFGTVLAKGNAEAGAITLIVAERGRAQLLLERVLAPNGDYRWTESQAAPPNDSDLAKFLEKRRRFDPDSWVLELDVASAERLTAELATFD